MAELITAYHIEADVAKVEVELENGERHEFQLESYRCTNYNWVVGVDVKFDFMKSDDSQKKRDEANYIIERIEALNALYEALTEAGVKCSLVKNELKDKYELFADSDEFRNLMFSLAEEAK